MANSPGTVSRVIMKLWIFFGFRIWGIGIGVAIVYFFGGIIPFVLLPRPIWNVLVEIFAASWICRSAWKLYKAEDPSIDSN